MDKNNVRTTERAMAMVLAKHLKDNNNAWIGLEDRYDYDGCDLSVTFRSRVDGGKKEYVAETDHGRKGIHRDKLVEEILKCHPSRCYISFNSIDYGDDCK